jgi:hypothetical protein
VIDPLWTLDAAVEFFRMLWDELEPLGYYVGLTGSVVTKGRSFHDLDIIIYPASTKRRDHAVLLEGLKKAGMKLLFEREVVVKAWRRRGSDDEKHIEVWDYKGKRVDIFFLS